MILLAIPLLLSSSSLLVSNRGLAQVEPPQADLPNKMVISRVKQADATISARPDFVWVGHTQLAVDPSTNPWHIHTGPNDPDSGPEGFWDWDHFGSNDIDSLQGWWPMRRAYSITGGMTVADASRPWWAIDVGNQGNYAPMGNPRRTTGVISYWHVDAGNLFNPPPFNGTPLPAMTWAPLAGSGSAWCGLRAHGDFSYKDPITMNAINQSVLEFNGENGGGSGTSKRFPGYPAQMDQLLYRDVQITTSSATLNLSFLYRTSMSTAALLSPAVRT
ncbi:MAG TPA: hypothetical protein VI653_09770, partial [Steroidobacteraceae bacterium]